MYFHVPSAHLALVTAPVTCVWFCSIPAPIAPLWESKVMTECCWAFAAAVPRTPDNMGGSLLCSRLEMASCWPVCYVFFFSSLSLESLFFFYKGECVKPVAASSNHLCHPEDMSPQTLIHEVFLSSHNVGLLCYHCGSQHWGFPTR